MKEWIRKAVRVSLEVFKISSAMIILLLLLILLMFGLRGYLAGDRLEAAVKALRGDPVEVSEVPAGIASEEWEKIHRAARENQESLDIQRRELESLRALNETRMERIRNDREVLRKAGLQLERERKAFEDARKLWADRRADEVFRDNVKKYEGTQPKTVVKLWLDLDDKEIVRYLRSMRTDVVADLFRELERDPLYTEPPLNEKGEVSGPSRLETITKAMQKD